LLFSEKVSEQYTQQNTLQPKSALFPLYHNRKKRQQMEDCP
jgi:hypothetical protein